MKIAIKGMIVANEDKWIYDYFGYDTVSPGEVLEALENAPEGETITLEISSPGGDVIAANEIYYAVATHPNRDITADIVGWAASAASYIALAATKVRILPSAVFMIHNTSGQARGDYHAMDQESKVLKNFNKAVANIYRLKTGLGESEILSLMDKESWLTAQDAKDKGFVDEIIGDEDGTLNAAPVVVTNSFGAGLIPKDKINALREKLKATPTATHTDPEPKPPAEPKPTEDNTNAVATAQIKKSLIF